MNTITKDWLLGILTALVVVLGCATFYLHSNLSVSQRDLQSTADRLSVVENQLASTTAERNTLLNDVASKAADNDNLQQTIKNADSKISTLKKLTETDKELLQKYSKVFFLNENYVPSSLTNIPTEYLDTKTKPQQIHTNVLPYLEGMISAAKADGVDLTVVSGYRSFQTQTSLKSTYTVVYGTGANKFSADQGYSEHQLGTAVDLNTTGIAAVSLAFANTKAYQWLIKNGYSYGFVLSYPKGNAYYQFEPWHWRFVGQSLAGYLRGQGKSFYDLDQRDIDAYLIKIFD